MEFIKISLIILITVLTVSCLPIYDKSVVLLMTITASLIVFIYIINTLSPEIETIKNFFTNNYFGDVSVVFRAMGISLVTQFVSDVALDSGNKALSNQMIFVGKTAIIILALPIFLQVMELINRMLQ